MQVRFKPPNDSFGYMRKEERSGICVSIDLDTVKIIPDYDHKQRIAINRRQILRYELAEPVELLTHAVKEVRLVAAKHGV